MRLSRAARARAALWWGFWGDLLPSGTVARATALAAADVPERFQRFPRVDVVLREQLGAGYLVPSARKRPARR